MKLTAIDIRVISTGKREKKKKKIMGNEICAGYGRKEEGAESEKSAVFSNCLTKTFASMSSSIGDHEVAGPGESVTGKVVKRIESYYSIHDEIGRGHFGKVFRATNVQHGYECALKRIWRTKIAGARLEDLKNEVDIMKVFDHPRVQIYVSSSGYIAITLR